jgi:hypothetical protein
MCAKMGTLISKSPIHSGMRHLWLAIYFSYLELHILLFWCYIYLSTTWSNYYLTYVNHEISGWEICHPLPRCKAHGSGVACTFSAQDYVPGNTVLLFSPKSAWPPSRSLAADDINHEASRYCPSLHCWWFGLVWLLQVKWFVCVIYVLAKC